MTEITVTRDEFEEMKARQAEMQALVKEIHDALMKPQPGHHNILGKWFAPINNLNAGTFGTGGSISEGLDIQRDARLQYQPYMNTAYAEYLSLLEP